MQHVAWHGSQSRSIARLHSADSSRAHQSHRKLSSEQQASVERLTRRPSVVHEAAELKEQGRASESSWKPPSASEFAEWVSAPRKTEVKAQVSEELVNKTPAESWRQCYT